MTLEMVRKGPTVRVRQRAFPANDGILGEVEGAENSPQPNKNPPSQCRFAESAAAYAAGNDALGERLFDKAWKAFTPAARGLSRSILRDDHLVDDALQIASIKLWKSIKRGYQPTVSWTAIAKTAVHHGSVQTLDRAIKHRCDEHHLFDDEETADFAQYRAQEISGFHDPDTALSLEHFAQEAERRAKPLWAAIIRQVAAGHIDREVIAMNLGKPSGTIRREIFNLKKTDLFDSITKREEIVDWRDSQDTERLFDFEYREI